MTTTILKDLEQDDTMNKNTMSDTKGGWFFYYNVFNRYQNPFGWGLQNSWINRSRAIDTNHNNFISYLRS